MSAVVDQQPEMPAAPAARSGWRIWFASQFDSRRPGEAVALCFVVGRSDSVVGVALPWHCPGRVSSLFGNQTPEGGRAFVGSIWVWPGG